MKTFDFGSGPVPAHRHNNPDGSVGGWVAETAQVDKTTYIGKNARVYGYAQVCGKARVYGNALVFGNAQVYENALVYGNARVYGNAQVYENALVYGNARVYGNALVYGYVQVFGYAQVYGNATVCERTYVMSTPTQKEKMVPSLKNACDEALASMLEDAENNIVQFRVISAEYGYKDVMEFYTLIKNEIVRRFRQKMAFRLHG